jgi:hypothetical protein
VKRNTIGRSWGIYADTVNEKKKSYSCSPCYFRDKESKPKKIKKKERSKLSFAADDEEEEEDEGGSDNLKKRTNGDAQGEFGGFHRGKGRGFFDLIQGFISDAYLSHHQHDSTPPSTQKPTHQSHRKRPNSLKIHQSTLPSSQIVKEKHAKDTNEKFFEKNGWRNKKK